MLPKTRGVAIVYLLVGAALIVAAVLFLKYVGKQDAEYASSRAHTTREQQISQTSEAIPCVALLLGVVAAYLGVVKLVFGPATERIGTNHVNGATLMFSFGLLAVLGAVGYLVIGVIGLRL